MNPQNSTKRQLLKHFVSPEQYDFWSREFGLTSAWSRCFARIVARKQETDNTVSLTLKPNRNFVGFKPGQHVNVSALINGVRVTRCYSMTNTPNAKGYIEITIRQEPNGLMSTWLTQQADIGSKLELGNVFGEMTLQHNATAPLLLLAAGSGITPIISLLRQAVTEQPNRPVTLMYWDKTAADFCFQQDLAALEQRHPQLSVHKISTRESLPSGSLNGRITHKQVKACVNNLADYQAYACGSNGFVTAINSQLGKKLASIQIEAFSPAPIQNLEAEAQYFELTLTESDRVIQVSSQANLLEQLEAEGVAVESGCRMGICNTCTCKKGRGSSLDITNNETTSETDAPIRLCVSRATSDLQLAL